MENAALVTYQERNLSWTPTDVMGQVNQIQHLMKSGMKDKEHFGVIPGCGVKPALLKPGAEKLCLMFRLAPKFEITAIDLHSNHREYRIVCSLYHINTQEFWGSGVGSCSTMESKYRWRSGQGESTGVQVPKAFWDLRRAGKTQEALDLIGGKGYTTKKGDDGLWYICEKIERQENPDIADTYNTVLKIAKKRALVDATLSATAASDIFTQDIDELNKTDDAVENKTSMDVEVKESSGQTIKGTGETLAENIFSAPEEITSKKNGQKYWISMDGQGNKFFIFDSKIVEFLKENVDKPVLVEIENTSKGSRIIGFNK